MAAQTSTVPVVGIVADSASLAVVSAAAGQAGTVAALP